MGGLPQTYRGRQIELPLFAKLCDFPCTSAEEEKYMSHVMRKSAFCICENKCVNQLPGNYPADKHFCFHYIYSTISLLPNSKIFYAVAIFFCSAHWFVSDLVTNPKDRFSRDMAHIEDVLMFAVFNVL